MATHIREILDRKGSDVATIAPDRTLRDVLTELASHNVGALVVSPDGVAVHGIISERDVVRAMARAGEGCLDERVETAMSRDVTTCGKDATSDQLMATMTQSRFRHVPVVEDGALVGIVSIGDVVKSRIDELQVKAESLEEYVTGSSY